MSEVGPDDVLRHMQDTTEKYSGAINHMISAGMIKRADLAEWLAIKEEYFRISGLVGGLLTKEAAEPDFMSTPAKVAITTTENTPPPLESIISTVAFDFEDNYVEFTATEDAWYINGRPIQVKQRAFTILDIFLSRRGEKLARADFFDSYRPDATEGAKAPTFRKDMADIAESVNEVIPGLISITGVRAGTRYMINDDNKKKREPKKVARKKPVEKPKPVVEEKILPDDLTPPPKDTKDRTDRINAARRSAGLSSKDFDKEVTAPKKSTGTRRKEVVMERIAPGIEVTEGRERALVSLGGKQYELFLGSSIESTIFERIAKTLNEDAPPVTVAELRELFPDSVIVEATILRKIDRLNKALDNRIKLRTDPSTGQYTVSF